MSDFRIVIRPNGPYRITGPVTLVDPTGAETQVPEGTMVSLCRCGHSTERPFCSGTHRDCGFQSEEPITRTFDGA